MAVPVDETRASEPPAVPLSALVQGPDGRSAWVRYWIKDPAWGLYAIAWHYLSRLLPLTLASALGARVGKMARWHHRKALFVRRMHKSVELIHKRCGPGPRSADDVVSTWFENVGRSMIEFSQVERYFSPAHMEIEGREHFDAARGTGRALIIVSVHLANWEAVGARVAEADFAPECLGTYQPQANRFENWLVHRMRRRHGGKVLPPGARTAFRLMSHLKVDKGALLYNIDEVHEKNIHFPLFGRSVPASGNAVNMAKLALAADALLLPIYGTRLRNGLIRVTFLPAMEPEHRANRQDSVEATVRKVNAVIEPIVRDRLDQWYMLSELKLK